MVCMSKDVTKSNTNCVIPLPNSLMSKTVKINENNYTALFDTGSKFNIISEKVYANVKEQKLDQVNVFLVGFGQKRDQIRSIASLKRNVVIDNEQYKVNFFAVSNAYIDIDIIIGEEFCKEVEIKIDRDGLHFDKTVPNENVVSIMKINTFSENLELLIDSQASKDAKRNVCEIIENYVPKKIKTTNIKMNIVLKDETPISSRPRWLPISERNIVESQTEQWLRQGVIENSW